MVDKRFRCDREHDPVAELARLIGQADRHARRAPVESGFREEITSDGDDESTGLPPAPQLPSHLDAREQGCGLDEHEIEGTAYQPCVTDQDYQNEVPSKRLRSLTLAMAITGLALVGSAGAFDRVNLVRSTLTRARGRLRLRRSVAWLRHTGRSALSASEIGPGLC